MAFSSYRYFHISLVRLGFYDLGYLMLTKHLGSSEQIIILRLMYEKQSFTRTRTCQLMRERTETISDARASDLEVYVGQVLHYRMRPRPLSKSA